MNLAQLFRWATGHRWISVVEWTDLHLALKYGFRTTVCSKARDAVEQNGRWVGALSAVERIELTQHSGAEQPSFWRMGLRFQSGDVYVVGCVTDDLEASRIGAQLSGIMGREVVIPASTRR